VYVWGSSAVRRGASRALVAITLAIAITVLCAWTQGATRSSAQTPAPPSNCPPVFDNTADLQPLFPSGTPSFPAGTATRSTNVEVLHLQATYGLAIVDQGGTPTQVDCSQPKITARAYRGTAGGVDIPVGRVGTPDQTASSTAKAIRLSEPNLCRITIPRALAVAHGVRSSDCGQALLALTITDASSSTAQATREACVIVEIERIKNSTVGRARRETIPVTIEAVRSFDGESSTGSEAAELNVEIGDPSVVTPHLADPTDSAQSALCDG
jgi:hypothetical protein